MMAVLLVGLIIVVIGLAFILWLQDQILVLIRDLIRGDLAGPGTRHPLRARRGHASWCEGLHDRDGTCRMSR